MNYSAVNWQGNFEVISTEVTPDGIERVYEIETSYTAAHGKSAPIGTTIEYAVIGEDEYAPGITQVWIEAPEEAPEFNKADYSIITEGIYNPLTMPDWVIN